jgi:hypothetical protein
MERYIHSGAPASTRRCGHAKIMNPNAKILLESVDSQYECICTEGCVGSAMGITSQKPVWPTFQG